MSYTYEDMTIAELKELLKARGLPVNGKTRIQLIERLRQSNYLKTLKLYESYENMTIAELKELLKRKGETTFGSKQDLVVRLTDGLTKKKIYQGMGKIAPDALPLSLLPSVNYHLRDYGINANDPRDTLEGLRFLKDKKIKKLFEQLTASIHTPYFDITAGEFGRDHLEHSLLIMSIVYTGDWLGFANLYELDAFMELETTPNFIMNWTTQEFTQLMRRQGPTGPGVFTVFNQFE